MAARTLILLALAALHAGAQADASGPAVPPRPPGSAPLLAAEVGSVTIRLANCHLVWPGQEAGLPVFPEAATTSSCQFARTASGQVQVLQQAGGRRLMLLVSPEPRPGSRWCDNRVRALIVDAGHVQLSVATQTLRTCSTGPFDDKLLIVLGRDAGAAKAR